MIRKPLYPFKAGIFRTPPILTIYLFWLKKVLLEFSIYYMDQFRCVTSLQKTDGDSNISIYKVVFSYYLYLYCKILAKLKCIQYYDTYRYLNKILEQIFLGL